ncbi:unnamed protein product, partial [Closterium sp. NIES-53]
PSPLGPGPSPPLAQPDAPRPVAPSLGPSRPVAPNVGPGRAARRVKGTTGMNN